MTERNPTSSPHGAADSLIRDGLTASAARHSAAAIELFSQACVAAPATVTAHFLLASELAQAGRWDEAEAAFANAVLVAPDFTVARYQLGLLQFSSGRAALALVTWQPLTSLPDESPFPHLVQGFAALACDDFSGALQHFDAGLRCEFDNEALRGDVSMLVQRVRATQEMALPLPAADGPKRGPNAESVPEHFLLSNYAQYGRPH